MYVTCDKANLTITKAWTIWNTNIYAKDHPTTSTAVMTSAFSLDNNSHKFQ